MPFFSYKNANISYLVSHFIQTKMTLACVACLFLLRCQTRSLSLEFKLPKFLVQKFIKTIYKFSNNGFINRIKCLRVHLTLCQTVLTTEKNVQLFLTGESKEYFLQFSICTLLMEETPRKSISNHSNLYDPIRLTFTLLIGT